MVRNLTKTLRRIRSFVTGGPVAVAANDAGERIETLRFSVPALRVGVLEYAPGQLQTKIPELQNKTVLLYYPPESVGDPDFLKSLENSVVVLGGHAQSTSEQDKKIDGWLRNVEFSKDKNGVPAAMVEGVVKGAREAAYVRQALKNDDETDFGASALIDIMGIRLEDGTTPDGQQYNAVAGKLVATHLTLAPSVRDPEMKIEIINSVVINSRGEVVNSAESDLKALYDEFDALVKKGSRGGSGQSDAERARMYEVKELIKKARAAKSRNTIETKNTENTSMTAEEIAALAAKAARDVITAKNAEDEMATLKNEMGELKNAIAEMAKNMVKNKEPDGGEKKPVEGENAEHKEPDGDEAKNGGEPATLENTKPAQKLVAAFASAYNADFGRKTPSFGMLAQLAGVTETDPAARIAAVNAKFSELESAKATATNAGAAPKVTVGGAF